MMLLHRTMEGLGGAEREGRDCYDIVGSDNELEYIEIGFVLSLY